jgi:hypothetical protein
MIFTASVRNVLDTFSYAERKWHSIGTVMGFYEQGNGIVGLSTNNTAMELLL